MQFNYNDLPPFSFRAESPFRRLGTLRDGRKSSAHAESPFRKAGKGDSAKKDHNVIAGFALETKQSRSYNRMRVALRPVAGNYGIASSQSLLAMTGQKKLK